MSETIWTFPLATQSRSMPTGDPILTIDVNHRRPCIWAILEPDTHEVSTIIVGFGTGGQTDENSEFDHRYIGTVQTDGGELVVHLFERS